MTKSEAKKRIEQLKTVIAEHRYNYHVLDKQTISDSVLDSLKHELYQLEQSYPDLITPDSPTQRVGGEPLPKFEKVTHARRMLSMEDVFTRDELEAWKERVEKNVGRAINDFFVMPKLDGLAVSLVYVDGILQTAATRGNGLVGEDVTRNIKTIESVPLQLRPPHTPPYEGGDIALRGGGFGGRVEVRGEIYFPVKAFEKLNREQKKAGKPEYANPRNTAAGSVRQLDSKVTAERGLAFVAWDLDVDFGTQTMEETWRLLNKLGFVAIPESKRLDSIEAIEQHWNNLQNRREKLGYWVDGMVIRVNDHWLYDELGVVGKTPRGLVAWKFPAQEATTVVRQVNWTVGRTGALTPVALVEPTWIGGTTVRHASLHNLDEIDRLDVRVGDTVVLFKAGDIIPKIKEVVKGLRPRTAQKIIAPKQCPICGSPVKKEEIGVVMYCANPRCFVQDREAILHAVRAFEIDGLGPQSIALFLKHGIISRQSDIFLIKPDEIQNLEGFAELSANKLVDEIQSKKSIKLSRFVLALGIRNVGEQTAIDLANHFHTITDLQRATLEQLEAIEGIGTVVAKSIVEYFARKHNRDLIEAYEEAGVNIVEQKKSSTTSRIAGKTFVITGTLESLSRDEAKDRIRAAGGKVSGSISSKTDFLIAGENPGSKLDKAIELEVTVLSEKAFLDKL